MTAVDNRLSYRAWSPLLRGALPHICKISIDRFKNGSWFFATPRRGWTILVKWRSTDRRETRQLLEIPGWRLRFCDIQDNRIVARVLRVGNRREVYR
jgi:hypothetical protein